MDRVFLDRVITKYHGVCVCVIFLETFQFYCNTAVNGELLFRRLKCRVVFRCLTVKAISCSASVMLGSTMERWCIRTVLRCAVWLAMLSSLNAVQLTRYDSMLFHLCIVLTAAAYAIQSVVMLVSSWSIRISKSHHWCIRIKKENVSRFVVVRKLITYRITCQFWGTLLF